MTLWPTSPMEINLVTSACRCLWHFGLQLTAIVFDITGFSHQRFIRFRPLLVSSAQLRFKSMDARFFWLRDCIRRGQYAVNQPNHESIVSLFGNTNNPRSLLESEHSATLRLRRVYNIATLRLRRFEDYATQPLFIESIKFSLYLEHQSLSTESINLSLWRAKLHQKTF